MYTHTHTQGLFTLASLADYYETRNNLHKTVQNKYRTRNFRSKQVQRTFDARTFSTSRYGD
jgi:hypothetical protein